ncbi:hypothetical protein VHARVF571_170045 [Vibrio harveyi]|nr:hypothetical protein VHARVF571_170045 [Vibrio harveyi]
MERRAKRKGAQLVRFSLVKVMNWIYWTSAASFSKAAKGCGRESFL